MSRLFVAVRPPATVLARIAELPRPDERGVRWVPPSQWHVTLRFLGEAEEHAARDALGALPAALAATVPGSGAVEAVLGPAVSRLGRSVVCIPVAGLDDLARAVVAVTEAIGDPPDPRPFAGHLTLARLRGRGSCGVAGTALAARFAVTEVELVRSTLASSGVHHEVIEVIALDAGGRGSADPDP